MNNVDQIINMLFIKNQLYTRTSDEIEQEYLTDRTSYLLFLVSTSILLSEDPYSVEIVNGVKDKIYNIISSYRFKNNDFKEKALNDMSNKILMKLNRLQEIDYLEIEKYIFTQLNKRRMSPESIDFLPQFISYDYLIIHSLENEKVDNIGIVEFLSGTYYLLNTYPILYKENKDFIPKSIEYIKNGIKKTKKNNKIVGKRIIKQLRNNK